MAKTPKQLTRVTNGYHPKHQLYQPGFNPDNGFWLPGAWATISASEWEARKDHHQKIYDIARARDAGRRSIDDLDEAEKQAYDFYSGDGEVYCWKHERVWLVGIEKAGPHIRKLSCDWLRKKEMRVIRVILDFREIINQAQKYAIPESLVCDQLDEHNEPINVNLRMVEQNRDFIEEMFIYRAGESVKYQSFLLFATDTFKTLVEWETRLLRAEWQAASGRPDFFTDIDRERGRYVRMRAAVEQDPDMRCWYQKFKTAVNACLQEKSYAINGGPLSLVIPEFYEDGSHGAWNAGELPWKGCSFPSELVRDACARLK